jgi:NAD(P)H-dependent FMN reductase
MKLTIINGTNRTDNQTIHISQLIRDIAKSKNHQVNLVSLNNFTQLFQGRYITPETATPQQQMDLHAITKAEVLIFVVPTYHSGAPAPLVNFLDGVKMPEMLNHKVIALVSSNDKNHDLGARQAREIINGILAHNKSHSFIIPRINITSLEHPDENRLGDFIQYIGEFL